MPKNAKQDNNIKLFQDQPVRTVWNEKEEKWYFSVVDVVRILTDQPDTRRAAKYWSVLKVRIKNESDAQLTTICSQLKMLSEDGKAYKTDAADTEQLFRITSSSPSASSIENLPTCVLRSYDNRIITNR